MKKIRPCHMAIMISFLLLMPIGCAPASMNRASESLQQLEQMSAETAKSMDSSVEKTRSTRNKVDSQQ